MTIKYDFCCRLDVSDRTPIQHRTKLIYCYYVRLIIINSYDQPIYKYQEIREEHYLRGTAEVIWQFYNKLGNLVKV